MSDDIWELLQRPIGEPAQTRFFGREEVDAKRLLSPRKISFAYDHKDALRKSEVGDRYGVFRVKFCETIQFIFQYGTRISPKEDQYSDGFWVPIDTESDFEVVKNWIDQQGSLHFLRDCLTLSVALDKNRVDNTATQRTKIGELEDRAKRQKNISAAKEIAGLMVEKIKDLPGYRAAKFVCGVPSFNQERYNLPSILAELISIDLSIIDLTPQFRIQNEKRSLKNLSANQKWDEWERVGAKLDYTLPDRASVILIDDKYQSGYTIQFLGSRLILAGAHRVYGMCAVKTLRDDDNDIRAEVG